MKVEEPMRDLSVSGSSPNMATGKYLVFFFQLCICSLRKDKMQIHIKSRAYLYNTTLHLRSREYHGRASRKTVRTRAPGYLL